MTKYKITTICLILVMCLIFPITASAHNFIDVPANCWFDESVQYVYENGFMNGTSKTTFSPNSLLDRGMIVTVLYRMSGSPAADIEIPFTDVAPNHYFYNAVQWAYQNGVVKGVTETEFMPLRSITRAEMVTMFYRCFGNGYKATENELSNYVDSVSIPKFAYDAFAWSVKNGIVTGMTANTIAPFNTSNRAQCAVIIQRIDNMHEHSFGDWKVQNPATCTMVGQESRRCICGDEEVREIAPLGHNYETEITTPTCKSKGYTTFTCSKCENSYVGDWVETIGHAIYAEVVEPTCTTDGYTVTICADCGIVGVEDEIPAFGHTWSDWEVIEPATAIKAGLEQRQCSVCSEIESREIPQIVLAENIAVYYKVVDGVVLDLVSGKEMTGATVHGDYFSGGKVVVPTSYPAYTIETIMMYNRSSLENPIGQDFATYGGVFGFRELENPNLWKKIKAPFSGGQIDTEFTLRPSLNYNTRVFTGGDSYWALSVDAAAGSYSVQVNDSYMNKIHWADAIRKSFTLSNEHKFKEFIIYNESLTKEVLAEHFAERNIELTAETATLIGRVTDGITHLGSAFAFTQTGRYGIPEWYNTQTVAGNYNVNDGNGLTIDYTISDYVEPDLGIDHSKYESLHIINEIETLYLGYKYALSAIPYPFNINHEGVSDQYDVSWKSSDESVAVVIDGLVIPQKTGTVTITATLRNTNISDSRTIQIIEKEETADKVFHVPVDYVSGNGNSFSDTDYIMTTNAIYEAIDEAYFAGYNHVIFPQINFYATPTGTSYFIPSGMTVEFPEGSAFYMMPSEIAKTDASGYTYFQMGGAWWSCGIPTEKFYEKTDEHGKVLGYYCMDAHLIMDKYYGEFYKEDATMAELHAGANEYDWSCVLLNIGKRAEYCSVEIREANCPAGFFILMGGKGNNEMINANGGVINYDGFVHGWLDDTGTIVENENWISTPDFYTVSPGAANGMDTLHSYYLGNWEHDRNEASQHLYDILWFDENKELIQVNRLQYVDEAYSNKPDSAAYFKISMQQSDLPVVKESYIGLYPDEAAKFCEIKNTNIINGADGLASVVGATDACWIHDNYVSCTGLLAGSTWSLDLEDGWLGMRGTIIERNILRMYSESAKGEYRGADTGILALSSGYNTFVISNYLGSIQQSWSSATSTHIINNVLYAQFSGFDSGTPIELRTKINAHIFYNIMGQESKPLSANGVVYYHGNTLLSGLSKW